MIYPLIGEIKHTGHICSHICDEYTYKAQVCTYTFISMCVYVHICSIVQGTGKVVVLMYTGQDFLFLVFRFFFYFNVLYFEREYKQSKVIIT